MSESGPADRQARTIAVIVPTYRRPSELREALASIARLQRPDWRLRVIVADNEPCQGVRAIVLGAGARYVAVSGRRSASAARNAAMALAECEFIAFLDDDDVWLATHLEAHIAALDAAPHLDAVAGRVISADTHLRPITEPWPAQTPRTPEDGMRAMLSGYYPQLGSVVVRGDALAVYGGFDETLIGGEDLDWLWRMARRGRLGFVEANSVLFRQRPRGSFDTLRTTRVGFDRRVFLWHALASWWLWESAKDFSDAWYNSLHHHYRYFVDAAASRAASGRRLGALKAVLCAAHVFPFRAVYHIVRGRRLGKALAGALSFERRNRKRRPLALASVFCMLEPLTGYLAATPF